ncbi:MAG: QueT transporter family protein [Oscillospiraceae bacterium]|nr:QueT transporter family protein [Oscillospiraceae bacterium]
MKHYRSIYKITMSAAIMAVYIVLMFATQSFAFGQYQLRIATALYAMAGVHPWLILPLGLANMLSNMLMGGLGPADIGGGLLVGLLTAGAVALLRRKTRCVWLLVLPIAIVPSFVVPIWLHFLLLVPYFVLVPSLLVGQAISAYTLGIVLLNIKWEKVFRAPPPP